MYTENVEDLAKQIDKQYRKMVDDILHNEYENFHFILEDYIRDMRVKGDLQSHNQLDAIFKSALLSKKDRHLTINALIKSALKHKAKKIVTCTEE